MNHAILRNITFGLITLFTVQLTHAADLKMAVNAPRGARLTR